MTSRDDTAPDSVAQSKEEEEEEKRTLMGVSNASESVGTVPTTIRWWRLRPWNRNHLIRRSDRYEAVLVLITAILILIIIPFAAAFGTATHTRREHQTQALRTSVHQVPAVLLEDTQLTPPTTPSVPPAPRTPPAPAGRHPTGSAPRQCPPTTLQRPVRRSPSASMPTETSPAPSPAPGTTPWPR